jgi:hypothetical protein
MFDSWKIDSQGAAGFSRNRYLLAVCGTLALAALATMALIAVPTVRAENEGPGAPSGDGKTPVVFTDNPDCADVLGPGYFELKQEPPADAVGFTDGTLSVDLDYYTQAGNQFVDFSNANIGVDAVIVKGGTDGNAYVYSPEDTADTKLHSPIRDAGPPERYFGISHVSFCYDVELEVEKTAETTFTRDYGWKIQKSNDADNPAKVSPGQTYTANYDVTVDVDDAQTQDSDWAVTGEITVTNPAKVAANGVTVDDVISKSGDPDISANVDCNGAEEGNGLPATIASHGELTCTYSADLPNGDARTNTATADSTTPGITEGSGTATVQFGAPTSEVDECVTVSDDKVDLPTPETLGTVCVGDAPKTFEYSKSFGPFPNVCETHTFTNTAGFETNDNKETGSASSTVTIEVQCIPEGGCTLTQGYWKTHSEKGPAPYDETWALLSSGADTQFLNLTGKTWYQVFWMPPTGGNAFLILAHQYQAAILNQLDGASVPTDVGTALSQAADLLDNYSSIPNPKGAVRNTMLTLAGTLGAYNEGTTGPGHCSEDMTSSTSA